MHSKEAYIALFDSGVGGISVLRELLLQRPGENYLYYGDSANAPYGVRSTQQVQELTLSAVEKLMTRGIKAIVIACNTATAAAISILRSRYPDTIIVGIEPALKVAADRFPHGRIGLMATQVTLREEKLAHQLARFPQVRVERIPAPGLVELIEAGFADSEETMRLLDQILSPYRDCLDGLVLGCTHYPFVKGAIRKILGTQIPLFDGGEGTARQTIRCLEEANLLHSGPGSVVLESSQPGMEELMRALLVSKE